MNCGNAYAWGGGFLFIIRKHDMFRTRLYVLIKLEYDKLIHVHVTCISAQFKLCQSNCMNMHEDTIYKYSLEMHIYQV